MEERIKFDLKQAMLAKDVVKVSTLRLLLSEIRNAQIKKGADLTDEEITSVIQKELKKRAEAKEAFEKGQRLELAKKEEDEAKVLKSYLPEQLSDEELTKLVEHSINEIGAKSISDMGRVIGLVLGKVAGKASGGRVSGMVREKLIGGST